MHSNRSLGIYGEKAATSYLENQGYNIIERNYRCKLGEIDIIAVDGDVIAFIEVKTRRSEKFCRPGDSVNFAKQKKIIKTALCFISQKKLTDWMSRFDVVEVIVDNKEKIEKVTLIKNAFEYSGRLGY